MSEPVVKIGDCRPLLDELPAESVQTVVTSPPYFGQRKYGDTTDQIGLETTLAEYVANMVDVCRRIRRVLRPDGTLWLNIGDKFSNPTAGKRTGGTLDIWNDGGHREPAAVPHAGTKIKTGLHPKQLLGVPWRTAFALQDDGWILRTEIIWHKPNGKPESCKDRPTRNHEYIFLLTRQPEGYYFDYESIMEPASDAMIAETEAGYEGAAVKSYAAAKAEDPSAVKRRIIAGARSRVKDGKFMVRKRSVWTVNVAPYTGDHFAVFPPELIKPCILAGSRAGDIVLDPFGGSGTTAETATSLGRRAITFELNADYGPQIRQRLDNLTPGLLL